MTTQPAPVATFRDTVTDRTAHLTEMAARPGCYVLTYADGKIFDGFAGELANVAEHLVSWCGFEPLA